MTFSLRKDNEARNGNPRAEAIQALQIAGHPIEDDGRLAIFKLVLGTGLAVDVANEIAKRRPSHPVACATVYMGLGIVAPARTAFGALIPQELIVVPNGPERALDAYWQTDGVIQVLEL